MPVKGILSGVVSAVGASGDGEWLLPDDGGDTRQSERNTRTVESRCLKQLLALGT